MLSLGEILAEEMGRPGLKRFAILHHGLDGVSHIGTGESFASGLFAFDHRHRHDVFSKIRVHIQHRTRFFQRFFFGRVGRVAFLPEKFGGPQKQARTHFPTHNVCPLVDL